MKEKIICDLYRVVPEKASFFAFYKGFRSPGFKYLFFRRLKDHYGGIPLLGFIIKLFLRRYMYKYGFQIGGKLGKGLFIGHFGTIVVSVNAEIGENCNLAHNVTIGAARGKRLGAPKIGDLVWIGTGAVIVGNIEIGNNVLISPNSFVNFDVPSNSIVLGNPGKIISRINPTEYYINNIYQHK